MITVKLAAAAAAAIVTLVEVAITRSTVEVRLIFLAPVIVKYMEKNLDTTKPRYSEHILQVPWPFVISRFHCSAKIYCQRKVLFSTVQC